MTTTHRRTARHHATPQGEATVNTPALIAAAFYSSLAAHLTDHPELSRVRVAHDFGGFNLQVSSYFPLDGELSYAQSLLDWYDSLTEPTIGANRHANSDLSVAEVWLRGVFADGTPVTVWTTVDGFGTVLGFTVDTSKVDPQPFDVQVLRDFVAGRTPVPVSA